MVYKQAGAIFNIIDHGFGHLLRYGRAAKAAAHITGTGALVANVRSAMNYNRTRFGIVVKTLLLAI